MRACFRAKLADMEGADRKERAEARRGRAVLNRTSLKRTERDLDPIAGEPAISLVHRLTQESWAAAGKVIPSYARDEIVVRFVPGRLT